MFGIMLKIDAWYILLSLVTVAVFTLLSATFGLVINLKIPNLHWTNETAAVKQGLSSVVAMFGCWGFIFLPVGLYFAFGKYMPIWSYILLWLVLFSAATVALLAWLYKRGGAIFAKLK
jgi:ABC-2 type transport system permease protein